MKQKLKKYGMSFLLVGFYYNFVFSYSFHALAEDNFNRRGEDFSKPYEAISSLSVNFGREFEFPKILSNSDVVTYRQIFKLQKDGLWQQSRQEIKQLNNSIKK